MTRKGIPKGVEHHVREECKQACANPLCREWCTATHELHHIDGDSSKSTKENLILVCGSCHNKITAGLFSESDVKLWKRMAESGYLATPAGLKPSETVINNFGGIASHHLKVENLTIKPPKSTKGTAILPGTVGADPDMRTYANYLVKRYIDWRKLGTKVDKRSFKPASAHGILAEGFGSVSTVLHIAQSRFHEWVAQAHSKIDKTTWGKINIHRNYHSYNEHLRQRHG